eukprot:GHVO01057524.1.p1 GENE.GHVO01057524.1~~GHVO01057524.1.p1  ORF type:complete len:320 (+),score=29.81 GHVO01057524.1:151-1110(+)
MDRIRRWWNCQGAWRYFVLTGLCDAFGNILGFIAQPYLSGSLFSLMLQANIPFTALTSIILLRRKYTTNQVASLVFVVSGAMFALIPQFFGGSCVGESCHGMEALYYSLIAAISTLPNAISFCVKEKLFIAYEQHQREIEYDTVGVPVDGSNTRGRNLDIFSVNSHGSLFQLAWTPVVLFINAFLGEYHNMPFLQYIWGGLKCMTGTTPENMHGCEEWGCCTYAPYAYGVYLVMNLAFNITLLALLKYGSALLGFVCMKAVLPISFILYAFIKWPLLDMSTEKPDTWKYISLAIVIVGTVWYRYASIQAAKGRRDYTYR